MLGAQVCPAGFGLQVEAYFKALQKGGGNKIQRLLKRVSTKGVPATNVDDNNFTVDEMLLYSPVSAVQIRIV